MEVDACRSEVSPLSESLFVKSAFYGRRVIICAIYRPLGTKIDSFTEHIIEKLIKSEFDVILCGDFNINLLNSINTNSVLNYVSKLSERNIIPLSPHPQVFPLFY